MADETQAFRPAHLAERLARLEAERDVRDLLAAYAYAADGCRDDEWLDLFTDDAVIDTTYEYNGVLGRERWEGREGPTSVLNYISGDTHHNEFYGRTMHLHSLNLSIVIDGDVATVYGYSLSLRAPRGNDDVRVTAPAMNRWTMVKVGSRWRIKERLRRLAGDSEAWGLLPGRDTIR